MKHILVGMSLIAVLAVFAVVCRSGSEPLQVHRTFHANGRMAIEQEIEPNPHGLGDRPHGMLREWDDAGHLLNEFRFSHGAVISARSFNADGSVRSERREGSDYLLTPSHR